MNIYVQPTFYQERPIPPRIRAAMEFIANCSQPVFSCDGVAGGSSEIKVRKLAPREQAAYDAAIEAMRLYFSSEMDFGDVPSTPVGPGDHVFTADAPVDAGAIPSAPPPPPPPPPAA